MRPKLSTEDIVALATMAARCYADGHLTIMKFSSGWKCMVGTPDLDSGEGRKQIEVLEVYPYVFSPNGDGYKDSTAVSVTASEPAYVWVTVRDSIGTHTRWLADSSFTEAALETAWDGRNDSDDPVGEGTYWIVADCVDLAGHAGPSESTAVELDMDQAIRRLDVILLFHANQLHS